MALIEQLSVQVLFVVLLLLLQLPRDSEAVEAVKLWEGGDIPYVFADDLTWNKKRLLKKAFVEIARKTCVAYTPWTTQKSVVELGRGFNCINPLGRAIEGEHKRIIFSDQEKFKNECKKMDSILKQLLRIAGGDTFEEVAKLYNCSQR